MIKEFFYECKDETKTYWTAKLVVVNDLGRVAHVEEYMNTPLRPDWKRCQGKGKRLFKKIGEDKNGRYVTFQKKKCYLEGSK